MSRRRRLLLAFYPRAWRRRYGDEFVQYLADLDAEQPSAKWGRLFNVALGAIPVRAAFRPATTPILVFLLSGAIATLYVYGRVGSTSREALVSGWTTGHNAMIIRSGHETFFAQRYAVQKGTTTTPMVRVHATSQNGVRVTLDCRNGKCVVHRPG